MWSEKEGVRLARRGQHGGSVVSPRPRALLLPLSILRRGFNLLVVPVPSAFQARGGEEEQEWAALFLQEHPTSHWLERVTWSQ